MSGLRLPSFVEALEVARGRGRNSEAPGFWNGLAGYWPFLQGGGKHLLDIGGHDNRGTLTNMDPATDWVTTGQQKLPWALEFDPDNDHVQLLRDIVFTGPVSITGWIRSDATSDYPTVIGESGSERELNGIRMTAAAGPVGYMVFRTGGASTQVTTSQSWPGTSFAIVRELGGALRGYRDGVDVTNGSPSNANTITFGRIGASAQYTNGIPYRFWDGLIGGLALHNRELLLSEVQQLYVDPLAMVRRRAMVFPAAVAEGGDETATLATVSASVAQPSVTATYESELLASLVTVASVVTQTAVTATYESELSAGTATVSASVAQPSVTATYESELSASLVTVAAVVATPAIGVSWVLATTATLDTVAASVAQPSVTASHLTGGIVVTPYYYLSLLA